MAQEITSYVRVLGVRSGKYVEFQFALGEPDLAVELILPVKAFEDFCKVRHAVMLPAKGGLEMLAQAAPGLYRPPADDEAAFPMTH